jgi:serine/threonine-protein kinase RsbW
MTIPMTTLTLESDPAKPADLHSSLDALFRDAGVDDSAAHDFTTAVIEAVNNIVKHGYRDEPGHLITVRWRCSHDSIDIEIRDRAQPPPVGFLEHAEMPPPDAESGRGVPMIRAYTHSASYARDGDENVLKLTRRR